MKMPRLYTDGAAYYDLLYSWKPYEEDSKIIHRLIRKNKKSPGTDLLDVACGTGNHLRYLKKKYRITGLDQSKRMLHIAKKKLPGVRLHQSDMSSFDLKKRFDVITCLFSSIAYVKTYTNLKKTLDTFSKHLKPGGVLIIEPFLDRTKYTSGLPFGDFVDKPDIKICRMNVTRRRGKLAILDFHYMIATKKGVQRIRDSHELALFDWKKMLGLIRKHGFQAKYMKKGLTNDRGLFVAVKHY